MTHGGSFLEIAGILALATALGLLGLRLKQPLIIMFLATGVLAGPSALGLIRSYDQIALLAQVGIALLLFIVGLKLDLHLIRTIGPVALATGLGQIAFTSAIGFAIVLGMGLPALPAAYVAVALTFSSTIIIVKLLSDKREIDSLSGRIAIGLLIVQDIAAILALIVLTSLGARAEGGGSALGLLLPILARGGALVGGVALLMRWVIPPIVRHLSRSPEHLTLFAVAWAVLLGAGSELLGFSKEVGAFLAGVSLASTDYRDAIGARLTTLRDFLLLFFFIELGARLDWGDVGPQLGDAVLLSLFVLLGNPLIVLAIMGVMGYRRRTSFLTGLTVAQISEFSLIVAALGLSLGHIGPQTMGLITLVGVITIFASTYLILYSDRLYALVSGPLRLFERRHPYREAIVDSAAVAPEVDVVLVGLGTYGSGVAEHLLQRGRRVVGVDFNPEALRKWRARGLPVIYGDVSDPEIHEQLPLERARWVASSVRDPDLNHALLNQLKQRGFAGRLALAARNEQDARRLERAGAHVVFRPFDDAAEQAADSLTYAMDMVPQEVDWPLAFREVRIQSGSAFAGQTLRGLALRTMTGVSILAISRAGHVHYDPDPDFQIYPGDRVVLIGAADELRAAEELLVRPRDPLQRSGADGFEIAELELGESSPLAGRSLGELEFRQRYSVTVVGIRRDRRQIVTPGPAERLRGGDHLVVIGAAEAVSVLRRQQPL